MAGSMLDMYLMNESIKPPNMVLSLVNDEKSNEGISEGFLDPLGDIFNDETDCRRLKILAMADYLQRLMENPKDQFKEDESDAKQLLSENSDRFERLAIDERKIELLKETTNRVMEVGSPSEVKMLKFLMRASLSLPDSYLIEHHKDERNTFFNYKYGFFHTDSQVIFNLAEHRRFVDERERKKRLADEEAKRRKEHDFDNMPLEELLKKRRQVVQKIDSVFSAQQWRIAAADMIFGVSGTIFQKEQGVFVCKRYWNEQHRDLQPLMAIANRLEERVTLIQCLLKSAQQVRAPSVVHLYIHHVQMEILDFRYYCRKELRATACTTRTVKKIQERFQVLSLVLSMLDYIDSQLNDAKEISAWNLLNYLLRIGDTVVGRYRSQEDGTRRLNVYRPCGVASQEGSGLSVTMLPKNDPFEVMLKPLPWNTSLKEKKEETREPCTIVGSQVEDATTRLGGSRGDLIDNDAVSFNTSISSRSDRAESPDSGIGTGRVMNDQLSIEEIINFLENGRGDTVSLLKPDVPETSQTNKANVEDSGDLEKPESVVDDDQVVRGASDSGEPEPEKLTATVYEDDRWFYGDALLFHHFAVVVMYIQRMMMSWLVRGEAASTSGVFQLTEQMNVISTELGELVRSSHMDFSEGAKDLLGKKLYDDLLDEGRIQHVFERLKCDSTLPKGYRDLLAADDNVEVEFENVIPRFEGEMSEEGVRQNLHEMLSSVLRTSVSLRFNEVLKKDVMHFVRFLSTAFLLAEESLLNQTNDSVTGGESMDLDKRVQVLATVINNQNDTRFKVDFTERKKHSLCISILPRVREPLSLVFKNSHMKVYTEVQRTLCHLYHVEHQLEQLVLRGLAQVDAAYLKRLTLTAATMANFVGGLRMSYVAAVMDTFEMFEEKLESLDTSRAMFDAHKQMLTTLSEHSLCTSRTILANKELNCILIHIDHFCNFVSDGKYERALFVFKDYVESARLFCEVLMQGFGNTDWASNILTAVDLALDYRDY